MKVSKPRWLVTAIVAALALVGAMPSPACACSCVQASVRDHFERADAVFAGRLVSRDDGLVPGDKATLVFEVSTVYKGEVAARQEIVTNASGASCGLELTGEGPHLVFGNADEMEHEPAPAEGQYVSSLCGGSRPFDAAARAELAPLVKATEPAPLATATPGNATPASATPANRLPAGWWIAAAGLVVSVIAAAAALVWRRRTRLGLSRN
jgi:hypothetical protein